MSSPETVHGLAPQNNRHESKEHGLQRHSSLAAPRCEAVLQHNARWAGRRGGLAACKACVLRSVHASGFIETASNVITRCVFTAQFTSPNITHANHPQAPQSNPGCRTQATHVHSYSLIAIQRATTSLLTASRTSSEMRACSAAGYSLRRTRLKSCTTGRWSDAASCSSRAITYTPPSSHAQQPCSACRTYLKNVTNIQ